MMILLLFITLLLSTPAVASTSAEEWSDFADNFATDLAPLITLFGEQVTKQFLSESTGFVDNVIFGLAPLGIITAVVSAIRLYGKASLKSFIGRAQEAHGVAEAELCSSTSYDVCELWSNGGICRVFGSPKILEFIYTKGGNFYPTTFPYTADHEPPHCGIYLPKEVLSTRAPDRSSRRWAEDGTSSPWTRDVFAPYPNLSLNVGTKGRKKRFLLGVAGLGLLVQGSFFVYATWATFYSPNFYTDDDKPQLWSFVLGMTGTMFLICGMTLCAVLVDRRSTERRFKYFEDAVVPDADKPRIHWLQCGDQRVGDQQFRSFAFSKKKKEYVTSYIGTPDLVPILGLHPEAALLLAITFSVVGFASQFVGFRGLHGSITLYQLACTLVMSIIRAWLRSRRLQRDQNQLEGVARRSESDELDWQALDMVQNEIPFGPVAAGENPRKTTTRWDLSSWRLDTGLRDVAIAEASKSNLASSPGGARIVVPESETRSNIVGFQPPGDSLLGENTEAVCSRSAIQIVQMLEGDSNCADAMFTGPLHISHSFPTGRVVPHFNINPASRALNIRARLGHLTGDPRQPPGSQWDPELQGVARRLQTALQKAADYIFRDAPLMEKSWKNVKALTWSAACDFSIIRGLDRLGATFPIHFVMHQQGQRWLINEYQLAAVMGLWRYTTFHQTRTSTPSKFASSQYPKRKVIQATDSLERTVAAIRLWITKNSQLEHRYEFCGSELEGAPFRLSAEASMQALSGAPWEPYLDGEFAEESHAKGLRVSLLSVQTTASFLEMMAQDIFTTFIFEVASIMDNVSDVSVRQPSISSVDSLLPNRSTASSELSNVHIDALARLLCESGLASEEAALMSIVPGFLYHAKLPTLDGLIARLLADAKRLRSEGQFEQGEAVLKRLLRICSPDHHEKVVRALGEHYRWALKSRSKVHRTFGLRSMETITHLNIQGAALSQKAVRALKDYAQLSEFLKKDPRHGDKFLEAKPLPMLEMESLLELRADEELPTDVRSRLKALLLVEKHNIRGRNSLAVQELLFVAIALGYIEVVDEIRAMNPNLLFELPSSELPSSDMLSAELQSPGLLLGGKQPLIIAVQQMLGSDKIDSSRDPTIIKGGSARTGVYTGFLAVLWAATQLTLERRVAGEAEDLLRAMLDWASIIDDLTDGQKNTPLMYTASSGNLAAVEILLECGVDFQVRNTAGETALSKAITKDLFSIAERILKEGQQTGGLAHGYLRHALSLAFRLRKQNFIELLLRNGADIDEPDERGETLLSAALQPSHSDGPELVSLLIKYGAMIQHNFLNILDTALVIGAPDWIRNLHARGYGVVRVFNHKHNLTELLEQRQRGLQNEALIKLLLELGVAVQGEDLNLAVRFRLPDDIVRLMLEKGAPTNAVLKDYGTPIQTLLRSPLWGEDVAEQERMLEVLITAGCDVNLDSPEWKATPLQIVCARSMFIRRVSSFRPPLDMADNDNLPTILLRAGAKVNLTAADIPGQGRRLIRSTPLELACLTGKAKVVRALLDAGADVNTTGGEFGPPLQAACMQFGQAKKAGVDIVRTLLAAGASTNTVSKPYGTALAAAAHSLMPEVVKVLLDAGADPALEISDQASCEYRDAWDAVHTPHGRLVESLRAAFDGMQTDPFTSVMLTYDSAGEKWDRIREVLTQHGIVRPAAEQRECPYMYLQGQRQTLHAQDDYIRLSPSNQEAKKKEGLDGSDKEETGSSRDSSRNGTSRLNSSGDRG